MFVAIEDVSEIGVELDGSYKRMSSLCIVATQRSWMSNNYREDIIIHT